MAEPTHLLLVDDEDALRTVIAERLAEEGFAVTEASSGEQALDKLERFAFDVLISDLRLPGIDGCSTPRSAAPRESLASS